MTAAQNAIIAQQGVVRAKHAFTLAQMALYGAAMNDENAALTTLNQLNQDLQNIQMQMWMQNCPFQSGQA
jgi:hypothetical protein